MENLGTFVAVYMFGVWTGAWLAYLVLAPRVRCCQTELLIRALPEDKQAMGRGLVGPERKRAMNKHDVEQLTAKLHDRSQRKKAFEKWLDAPTTRLALSLIPAGEKQDALRLTLESCFDAGFETGAAFGMSEVIGAIMTDRKL